MGDIQIKEQNEFGCRSSCHVGPREACEDFVQDNLETSPRVTSRVGLHGRRYVKDEFKRHKKANPEQTVAFMEAWAKYAITVSRQVGIKGPHTSTGALGNQMTVDELNQFSETQLHQLFDLYTEATKIPEMKDDS